MSYEYNNTKPEALLTGYTSVRGAELKTIYGVLDVQGDIPVSALKKRFGRPYTNKNEINTDHVDDCLKFLKAIDMVEVSAQDVVSKLNEDIYPEISFEPRVLYHIRQQPERQYHLSYVFDVMAKQNRRRIPQEVLLEEVADDDEETFGLQWNEEKIRMWANLSDTLGAISYVTADDDNEIVASPTRRLLHELLTWYSENGEDPERLSRALGWIDEEFLPMYASRPGTPKVTPGVADVVRNMEEEDVLQTRSMSDTENVVDLPRRKGGTEAVATFTMNDRLDCASYRYPLDRSERRVTA
ncbi:hypothetical protein VB779_06670 [Haloarculaceae archaeon H-GB11]|nr:hypothetical protein [Haloarculaceae archaeon H-GB11]